MNLDEVTLEHIRISNCIFDEEDNMTETDEAYNRQAVLEAYRPLLHERSVIDDCCERFRKTFKTQDMFLVEIL